jgi:DNA-binding MurR/RpiR family transcriptional regulator
MQEEEAAKLIEQVLRINQLTQAALAKAAGVHQSTVSRILDKKTISRRGQARARLIAYARNALKGEMAKGTEKVLAAFESVWDGSEEHAAAVARIIDALADLRPSRRE